MIENTQPVLTKKITGNKFTLKPGRIMIYVVLILGVFLAVLPFYWMISTSLMTLGETLNRQWIPASPQWENFAEAWREANFDEYFWNSVIIAAVTLSGLLFTSILAGYAFARIKFFGRNFLFALLLSTLMIPESVTIIPKFMMVRGTIPPLSWFEVSWLNRLEALTIPFMASAFNIFLLRQFFAKIPNELYDAARIDGAGHLRFLVQVCLPLSKAPVMTVLIFAFIGSWNAFMWPLLVTNNDTWRPLMVGLWTFVSEAGPETHLLMAGAVIAIIPMIILYFLTQKQFTEGIATTGLKG